LLSAEFFETLLTTEGGGCTDKVRVQKIMADSGYCSRRKAEDYIESGVVRVNGRPAKLGDRAVPESDIITVNGERLAFRAAPRRIKLYKPRGYICSLSDPRGKKLITELLGGVPERVYPVGRLDVNSEGIIFLTNDGNFSQHVTHPKNKIKKTYRVTVPSLVTDEKAAFLAAGVELDGGEKTRPCRVEIITASPERSVLKITVREGKNRQIRRMCEAAGLTVTRLKRVSIGGVKLGMLKPGEYAELTREELKLLGIAAGKKP
jgi:23S rRNA pseudouridine2605 synthase